MEDHVPHDIEMKNISNVFFDTVSGMLNMRDFKSQEIAHNHCDEEREINCALHNGCGIKSDSDDVDLQKQWLEEDKQEGGGSRCRRSCACLFRCKQTECWCYSSSATWRVGCCYSECGNNGSNRS